MSKSIKVAIIIGIVIFALLNVTIKKEELKSSETVNEVADVISVIDGDTITVKVENDIKKVRFIGIDCPELDEPFGSEAKEYLVGMIEGKTIYLTKDISETDQYGRLLRYIWLERPNVGQRNAIESTMLNVRLIAEGYAKLMTVEPDNKYEEVFKEIENDAQSKRMGIWMRDK